MDETVVLSKYAPVMIPTLCRYEHFKRCLESLERCTGADKTDIYVGLDYPPSEKYVDGWKKIDEYLKEKERSNGFHHLNVRRRDHNCGVSNAGSNVGLLMDEIRKFSDSYILSEDDNEFAPNFLEYINWGLETFRDDNSVFAICGFKDIDTDDISNSVYKLNTVFCAWGYGTWFSKKEKMNLLKDHKLLKKWVDSMNFTDIFSKKVTKASSLLYQIANNTFHGDMIISLLPENEKWCIYPKVNKVRNWGQDGTGVHGGTQDAFSFYSTLPIDTDEHFVPIISSELFDPLLLERFKKKYKKKFSSYLKAMIVVLVYKLTGFVLMSNKKDKWLKVRLQRVQ